MQAFGLRYVRESAGSVLRMRLNLHLRDVGESGIVSICHITVRSVLK